MERRKARPAPWRPLPAARRPRLVAVLRALGDGSRLEILRLLASSPEPLTVAAVTRRFRFRQPTISFHLRVLRDAGLAEAVKEGRHSLWRDRPGGLAEGLGP